MKFIIPVLILFLAIAASPRAQERTVVATVDSTPIYLDQIGGSEHTQQGEIKFVEPDVEIGGTDLDSRIILLRKRIIDQLLLLETELRAISPPEELVTREVNAYAERQWKLLFPNADKKKEVLSRMQLTGLKILEGLTIWKKDRKLGDEFAKKELTPLGMTPEAWSFYTAHSNDPEILAKLKKWEDIDNMSDEEIKEFLFLTKNEEHRKNIKYILAEEMLKDEVTETVSVSPEETARLGGLIYGTQWIDIIIIPGDDPALKKLGAAPKKERGSLLTDKLKSNTLRLPRTDSKNPGPDNSGLKEFMVIAAYTDSLDPGALSSVIEWPLQAQDPGSFAVYIVQRQEKKGAPTDQNEAELKTALFKFKRDREFANWIDGEMKLRTEILIPEYRKALGN